MEVYLFLLGILAFRLTTFVDTYVRRPHFGQGICTRRVRKLVDFSTTYVTDSVICDVYVCREFVSRLEQSIGEVFLGDRVAFWPKYSLENSGLDRTIHTTGTHISITSCRGVWIEVDNNDID